MTPAAQDTYAQVSLHILPHVGLAHEVPTENDGLAIMFFIGAEPVLINITTMGHAYLTHRCTTRPYTLAALSAVLNSRA